MKKYYSTPLRVLSTIAAVMINTYVFAEPLVLNCAVDPTDGAKRHDVRIEIDNNGAAVTDTGATIFYKNVDEQGTLYHKKFVSIDTTTTQAGSTWGRGLLEVEKHRATGVYRASAGTVAGGDRQVFWKGACTVGQPVPQKP